MPELIADRSKSRPTRLGRREDVGQQVAVDDREDDRAGHDARDRPRPPSTTIARMKIENENSNWPR